MIGLKEAIKVAKDFINEVYEKQPDLLLESARLDKDEKIWSVSFSLPRKYEPINQLQVALGLNHRIVYKTVKIDENGEVTSMEMGVPGNEPEIREAEPKQLETV
ncbi:hypothetical protein BH24ACI1_BH24ACI1_15710 [soil metagenome]|jgi:hypothetical protein